LISIPYENLYLIYGGKIMQKSKYIYEYCLQSKGCLYAVDSKKYMRTVSKEEYLNRISEVRKDKENNKIVAEQARK
jgi:uncharacterized protein YutD